MGRNVISILSETKKQVIVIALAHHIVGISYEELLAAAINDVNSLDIIVMRAIITNADDSSISEDIRTEFDDVFKITEAFVVYDIGAAVEYLIDIDLVPII